jgi:nitroimidazol reductase NimA-like FMN-containing flavoprotein (pyridoxamine 5'-phosphate oxidase superfamily)
MYQNKESRLNMSKEDLQSEQDNFMQLLKKKVTKKLLKKELEQKIVDFLKSSNLCVLATSKDDLPRATPIEYYSQGTILYMAGEPGTKIRNIQTNPDD